MRHLGVSRSGEFGKVRISCLEILRALAYFPRLYDMHEHFSRPLGTTRAAGDRGPTPGPALAVRAISVRKIRAWCSVGIG
jgi:hypothetical protein